MKYKKLILLLAVFFLVVNTSYFWEGKLGLFAFPVFLALMLIYLALIIVFCRMLILNFKEKFNDRQRLFVSAGLLCILVLTFFKPSGIIDFDGFSGKNLLVAGREGAANCTTTLKLKENNFFVEKTICFGVDEVSGSYSIKGDTIFFRSLNQNSDYYTHAVVKRIGPQNGEIIVLYKGESDTIGSSLQIIKNELIQP